MAISKPLAILLNGLTVYQPSPFTPLDPLGYRLREAGYEVCVTNHFNTGCRGRSAALIIGHSQGGATAIELGNSQPAALVITFDAVRTPRCLTYCVNYKTQPYPLIPGANNVPVPGEHITFVLSAELQSRVVTLARTRIAPRTDLARARVQKASQRRGRPVVGRSAPTQPALRPTPPSVPPEAFAADDEPPSLADRWPNTEFNELPLTLEQLCVFYDQPEVCPK